VSHLLRLDSVGTSTLKRALKSAAKKLEARSQIFARQVDDASMARALHGCSDAALHLALEAVKSQVREGMGGTLASTCHIEHL